MKKNISINLQGIIFHIEEDGYEVLSRYLAEVKAHFSGYRGHDEIVSDIEGRIAEIFAARLSDMKQVVALEDVQAMVAKMGRVSDFQSADEAEDDDELLADAVASGTAQGTYAGGGQAYSGTGAAGATAPEETRQLFRDMSHRKIAGVCAGLAQYFHISAVWVRLIALASLLSPIIGDFIGFLPGFVIVSYVILWIVLPKRYDTPEPTDGNEKQLFRDTDTGKIGGVSAGLAAYLGTDVSLVRILFLVGFFVGFGLILYIILWIAVPEAKTVADRMRMRGDALTLSGIASNARNYDDTSAGNRRPVGTFFEDLAKALNPLLSFVGTAIRIFAGVMLAVIGFSLLVGFTITLGAALGLVPESQNPTFGDASFLKLLEEQPSWAWMAGYAATAIPSLAMLLLGIGLLLRRVLISRTVGWSMFALWLLSIIGVTVAVARQSREFQYSADVEQSTRYAALTAPVLRLETRRVERDWDQHVDVRLAAADSGKAVEIIRLISADGASEAEASRTAATSVAYTVRTRGDSTLILDDHFSFQPNARYRDQDLELTLRLPRDRTFRLSEGMASWLGDDNFAGNSMPDSPENYTYRLRGNKLECISCPPAEERNSDEDSADYEDGADEEGMNVHLDFGQVGAFETDENAYGSERQSFEETDFDEVSIVGPYRVVVRHGNSYEVKAAGNGRALRDLKVDREGSELLIRPRNRDMFDSRRNGGDKVLITITTPELNELKLVGGSRAQISGFESGDLRVQQAGGSQFRLDATLNDLELDLAAGCRAELQGSANNLDIDGAAGCEIAAADFTARRADVDLVGGSKARLHVTNTLDANAVGASMIEYSGSPSSVRRNATGASSVKSVD
ncbi:PspC domain-containing protein [Hymenobacter psychrotolerans]|uniref:Phage shock protein C (PspC) family protein n=1 Tax=Hymenobacter psychrotolerans DSM 18569 TaxID=1121959 RepID=A0A1M6XF58_9BACT|nr:PspC domain-containing protein [Hymenobacter psychrotolerans]SHL04614.1 phage shock protein C (PspC) family protein [Hymenobacter psychrotolerans DSM 18569]